MLGWVHPERVWTKAGARPGDSVILTKPLGVGLVTTAFKAGEASPEDVAVCTRWMMQLNKDAAAILRTLPVHAANGHHRFWPLGPCLGGGRKERRDVQAGICSATIPGCGLAPLRMSCSSRVAPTATWPTMASMCRCPIRFPMSNNCSPMRQRHPGGFSSTLAPQDAEAFLARYVASGGQAWVIGRVENGEPRIENILDIIERL